MVREPPQSSRAQFRVPMPMLLVGSLRLTTLMMFHVMNVHCCNHGHVIVHSECFWWWDSNPPIVVTAINLNQTFSFSRSLPPYMYSVTLLLLLLPLLLESLSSRHLLSPLHCLTLKPLLHKQDASPVATRCPTCRMNSERSRDASVKYVSTPSPLSKNCSRYHSKTSKPRDPTLHCCSPLRHLPKCCSILVRRH